MYMYYLYEGEVKHSRSKSTDYENTRTNEHQSNENNEISKLA